MADRRVVCLGGDVTTALAVAAGVLLVLLIVAGLAHGRTRRQLSASREETSAARLEAASLAEQLAEARRTGQGADAVGDLARMLAGQGVSRGTFNTDDGEDIAVEDGEL